LRLNKLTDEEKYASKALELKTKLAKDQEKPRKKVYKNKTNVF